MRERGARLVALLTGVLLLLLAAALAGWQNRGASSPVAGPAAIADPRARGAQVYAEQGRSEEHTSELQSLMRISYAVFCLKKKNRTTSPIHVCTSPCTSSNAHRITSSTTT